VAAIGKTRAGTPLTPEYERQLEREAEAGFDPATLQRRRPGRPSLSGRAGRSRRLDVRVDDDTLDSLQKLARRQDRAVSDVVREALERYLELTSK
jgi:hypothetical protein